MNGTQRLSVIHSLLNPYKPFLFDYQRDISAKRLQTTKDCIAPTQIDFRPDGHYNDCVKFDNGVYAQVLVMKKFGSELSDRALADMAHAQGMRIWFCELTPWKGYTRNLFGRGDDIQWSPEYDALRLELNAWFQGADCPADGYIPLDALADPNDPDALVPAYTTDGVHHTPAGQRALAALIPEDIFVT